ncbi:MAG: ribosome-associated translation inhibitor RaiA [Deltaproteobacteria bacterium]|nr:ribosome-associated translation inhibitor RaiA [Deltaproteobacteria bacterium]
MRVTVTFRHIDSSEPLRNYAEEKTERLAKYLFEPIEVHWILSVEKIRHIAEATIAANGVSINAESKTGDLYSAIDGTIEKLDKQVRRHKEKVKTHKPGKAAASSLRFAAGAALLPETTGAVRIVRKENQFIKPMSVEEAAMQMDAAGGDFLVFTDSSTQSVNVIYRMKGGDYGLIEARAK